MVVSTKPPWISNIKGNNMSVPEQLPIVSYIANGTTTSFAITFVLHDDKYLLVTKNKELMPVGSYSIQDGSVIFGTAPITGDEITLARDTQLDRETNFKSYDNSFRPESINWDLDKLWHVLQEQNLVDAKILARIKEEIEWRRTHDENIVLNIDDETDQRRIVDDRIREEIAQEVQARRTLDLNYDTLAQVRDLQVFGALKQYLDTILASTTPNIFGGITAGVVFALDKKSIQTHLEEILNKLEQDRIDIDLNAKKSYVDEKLDLKANFVDVYHKNQTYSSTEVDRKISPKADQTYVDNALTGFTNGAAKFYPTLADANVDIANIQPTLPGSLVRDKIEIGEIENGGTWYKDTFNATKLTKSPYDTLTITKEVIREKTTELSDIFALKEEASSDDVLFRIADINGVQTWLEVNKEGKPTDYASKSITESVEKQEVFLPNQSLNNEDYLFILLDKFGVPTSFALNKNGDLADITLQDIAKRLQISSANSKAFSDTSKMAVWGSSTIDYSHPQWGQVASKLDIFDIFYGGKAGESVETICARQGSVLAKIVIQSGKLLGSTENQAVSVTNFFIQGFALTPYSGKLNGVSGVLSYSGNSTTGYFFRRSTAGADITVDPGKEFEFIPDATSYKNSIGIINIGKNNLTNGNTQRNSAQYVFEYTKKAYEFMKPIYKFVLVIGHFVDTNSSDAVKQRVFECNQLLKEHFGEVFYDLQSYLMSSKIWLDTGITPTQTDLTQQSSGYKPDSLSLDALHMNTAANIAYTNQVKDLLIENGWYNNLVSN